MYDRKCTQAVLDRLSDSILGALQVMAAGGLVHCNINPNNIVVRRSDFSPVLIDFLGVMMQKAINPDEYSPIELYSQDKKQAGPWTDIYGFAAVLHEAVTCQCDVIIPPLPRAQERVLCDTYHPLQEYVPGGMYRPSFLKAIDWGVALYPKDRPQSITNWREALLPQLARGQELSENRAVGTKIFLSYRRNDTAHIAGRIYDRLESEFGADDVFFDVAAIPVGVDFVVYTETRIAHSAVLLAIIGQNWVRRSFWLRRWVAGIAEMDYVIAEIEIAFRKGVPVIPVLVDGAQMPIERDLPSSVRRLTKLNAKTVRSGADFRADLEIVLSIIRSLKKRNSG